MTLFSEGGGEGEECEGYIYYSHTESHRVNSDYAQKKKTNKRPKSVNNVDVRTTESKTGQ